jgi:2-oxoglutarate ferredoxin oxidoreductase subunit alpha
MSMGQMLEDVERIVGRDKKVGFFGRTGGIVPSPEEVVEQIRKVVAEAGK